MGPDVMTPEVIVSQGKVSATGHAPRESLSQSKSASMAEAHETEPSYSLGGAPCNGPDNGLGDGVGNGGGEGNGLTAAQDEQGEKVNALENTEHVEISAKTEDDPSNGTGDGEALASREARMVMLQAFSDMPKLSRDRNRKFKGLCLSFGDLPSQEVGPQVYRAVKAPEGSLSSEVVEDVTQAIKKAWLERQKDADEMISEELARISASAQNEETENVLKAVDVKVRLQRRRAATRGDRFG